MQSNEPARGTATTQGRSEAIRQRFADELIDDAFPGALATGKPGSDAARAIYLAQAAEQDREARRLEARADEPGALHGAAVCRKDAAELYARAGKLDDGTPNGLHLDQRTPLDALVREFNSEYAVTLVGNQVGVLWERSSHHDGPPFQLLTVNAFHEWHRPRTLLVGGREQPASKQWMKHPDRRQFERVVFAPGDAAQPHTYNLFRGFAVEPAADAAPARCQLFLDHIADNVCGSDERLFSWVMGWFAALVQRPGRKLGTAIVLRGAQGVGKTIVGKLIGSLLIPHYALVDDERFVTGRFNSHLAGLLLLQLDEATWGGDHAAAGKLKNLITGEYNMVEFKGKEPVPVRNHTRLLITSNAEWVVPAGLDERRFAVFDVSTQQRQNGTYFRKIEEQMDAGGREALLRYLLDFDTTDVPLHEIPRTSALLEQKLSGLTPEQAWWMEILRAGALPGDRAAEGVTPVEDLYKSYIAHAEQRGITRRGTQTQLGMFLRKHVEELERSRRTVARMGAIRREYFYRFPELAKCRRAIAEEMRAELDWEYESSWEASE